MAGCEAGDGCFPQDPDNHQAVPSRARARGFIRNSETRNTRWSLEYTVERGIHRQPRTSYFHSPPSTPHPPLPLGVVRGWERELEGGLRCVGIKDHTEAYEILQGSYWILQDPLVPYRTLIQQDSSLIYGGIYSGAWNIRWVIRRSVEYTVEYTVERGIYGGGWNIRWNIRGIHGGTWNIRGLDVGYTLERGICGLYVEYAVERLGGRGWLAVRPGMATSTVKQTVERGIYGGSYSGTYWILQWIQTIGSIRQPRTFYSPFPLHAPSPPLLQGVLVRGNQKGD